MGAIASAMFADEENHSDVEITGETEGSSVVKQERDDSLTSETLPFDDLDDSDDDVICLDRQMTIKYMTGELVHHSICLNVNHLNTRSDS